MRRNIVEFLIVTLAVFGAAFVFGALAIDEVAQKYAGVVGAPVNWQLNFHAPDTPFASDVDRFRDVLLGLDLFICALVASVLLYAVWRFRRSRHPTPSTVDHNTPLEVFWTVVPAAILLFLAVPSIRLVYAYNVPPKAEMTLKVTGHQWYWEYQYPDQGNLDIYSIMVPTDKLKPGQPRLLTVDHEAVLPTGTVIRIEVTGGDVIHSFMVPSLGLQKYAVPGRLNVAWAKIDKPGVYYGQCSQICGQLHAFMPIVIHAEPPDQFAAWVKKQKGKPTS